MQARLHIFGALLGALCLATIAAAEPEPLRHTPPRIAVSYEPAVLLLFDGRPAFRTLPGQDLGQAVNTPFLVLKDEQTKRYWLSDGTTWFSAKGPLGPWQPGGEPPQHLADLAQEIAPDPMAQAPETRDVDVETPYRVPRIITATQPTELVTFDGQPTWAPLAGERLAIAVNSTTTVVRAERTGRIYVLLAGRWYESRSFDGPWTFVRPDRLPVEFAAIPADGGRGATVRAHVAGTPEAQLALAGLDDPESLDVERSEAQFEATYDGAPKFEAIRGTKVSYAVNSPQTVLWVESRYYALEKGVWFTARSPHGPWEIADWIPPEIDTIPASSPVYNASYVDVANATDEVVTYSVYPGYYGYYSAYGTVCHGTGYWYPAWSTPFCYYPRPYTWGFGFAYDPWYGTWGFGNPWCSSFWGFGYGWGITYGPYPWGGWYGGWGAPYAYYYGWGPGFYGHGFHGHYAHYGHGYYGHGGYHGGDGCWTRKHDGWGHGSDYAYGGSRPPKAAAWEYTDRGPRSGPAPFLTTKDGRVTKDGRRGTKDGYVSTKDRSYGGTKDGRHAATKDGHATKDGYYVRNDGGHGKQWSRSDPGVGGRLKSGGGSTPSVPRDFEQRSWKPGSQLRSSQGAVYRGGQEGGRGNQRGAIMGGERSGGRGRGSALSQSRNGRGGGHAGWGQGGRGGGRGGAHGGGRGGGGHGGGRGGGGRR